MVARSRMGVSFGASMDLELVMGEDVPAACQAIVVPQDVHLVMGDVGDLVETGETPAQVLGDLSYRTCRLGSLLLGPTPERAPLLLQAVVYDFARTPAVREEDVCEALVLALEQARRRGFRSLAVRPLGTAPPSLEPAAFLRILTQTCHSAAELGTSLRRVSLLLPSPADLARYEALVHRLVERRSK